MSIIFENVSKSFDKKEVLKCINLKIDSNQVYCLLGRNGAGKSTLINIACGLISPDEGSLLINRHAYANDGIRIKQSIGLQSQYDTLIEELNAFDYLKFIGKIYHMKKSEISSQVELLTEYLFDDVSQLKETINTYSAGIKKR